MKVNCNLLLFISLCFFSNALFAQSLEIELSTEGIVFPRMDTELRDGLNAIQGQCIYNTETLSIECFDGESWDITLPYSNSESVFNPKQSTVLRPADQSGSNSFGESIDIDGNYVIVGDSYENDIGAAYIFHHNGIEWYQQERLLEENGGDDFQFGHSVSISNDYAIVGSILTLVEGEEVGVVYVYKNDGESWAINDTLIAFDGQDADRFGESVMINDDFLIIGSPDANSQSLSSGQAYIYKLQNDEWLLDTFFAPLETLQSSFGQHVAITEKYAVVSAIYDRSVPDERGSVFVYKKTELGWEIDQNIRPSDGSVMREFGSAIAIDDESLMIGARVNAVANSDYSQAYYFKKNLATDLWEEEQILKNPEGPHIKDFGLNLSMFQNTAVMITQDATDNFNRISQIRIYDKVGSTWKPIKTFTPFGVKKGFITVKLNQDWLLLGNPLFSTDGVLEGGLFIY